MAEISDVRKEDKKVNGQFRYISFNQVYKDVKPLFIKHGIVSTVSVESYIQDGNMGTMRAEVRFVNVDAPEEFISMFSYGQGISGNRNGTADDKSSGKALSYLHKNAICKLLLLGGSEKDEVDNDAKSVQTKGKGKATTTAFPTQAQAPVPFGQQQAPANNPFASQGNNPQ